MCMRVCVLIPDHVQVFRCSLQNPQVAIKKVSNAFQDLIDAKRILREMKLLRHFNHENVRALCHVWFLPSCSQQTCFTDYLDLIIKSWSLTGD
jgi:hypothetical protein